MPSIQFTDTVKYYFTWEDLYRPNEYLDSALAIGHRTRQEFIEISKQHRQISGRKRAAKYMERQAAEKAKDSEEPQVEVMQSITEAPANSEEVERYNQSTVATGSKPDPVDVAANPAEFKDAKEAEVVEDVAMEG